jgi:hypothetical protein
MINAEERKAHSEMFRRSGLPNPTDEQIEELKKRERALLRWILPLVLFLLLGGLAIWRGM